MKKHETISSAYDNIRTFNYIVGVIDRVFALLKNQDVWGNPIEHETTDETEILNILKAWIEQNLINIMQRHNKIVQFVNAFDQYDLTQYSDKTLYQLIADKLTTDTYSTELASIAVSVQINNLSKLAKIADRVEASNPFMYATPVGVETWCRYMIILHDWLDASDYTLRDINPNSGATENLTDEQKIARVKGYLNQYPNLTNYTYPADVVDDLNELIAVKDWVLTNIDTADLITVADYIANNIPKLPLIRRQWA